MKRKRILSQNTIGHLKAWGQLLKILASLAFLFSAEAFSSQNKPFDSSSAIIVANEGADFKPFYFMDSKHPGVKTGFEIELLDLVFKEAGLSYNFTTTYDEGRNVLERSGPIRFADLLPGLGREGDLSTEWDVVTSTLGITEERRQFLDFTIPIMIPVKHFFGLKSLRFIDRIPEDLVGLTIGAEKGTLLERYLEFLLARLQKEDPNQSFVIKSFGAVTGEDSPSLRVLKALDQQEIDLMVTDLPKFQVAVEDGLISGDLFAARSPELVQSLGGEYLGRAGVAMALQKGSPLKVPLDRAIQNLIQTGLYRTLYLKWFKTEPTLQPEN